MILKREEEEEEKSARLAWTIRNKETLSLIADGIIIMN